MAQVLFEWVVLSIVVWSISTTLSRARVLRPLRNWIRRRNDFLGEGITCQYCVSHWVAFAVTLIHRPQVLPPAEWPQTAWLLPVLDYFTSAFAVIGLGALIARTIAQTPPNGIHPDLAAERALRGPVRKPASTATADPTARSASPRRSRPNRGSRLRRRPGRLPPFEPAVLPGWSAQPAESRRTPAG